MNMVIENNVIDLDAKIVPKGTVCSLIEIKDHTAKLKVPQIGTIKIAESSLEENFPSYFSQSKGIDANMVNQTDIG